MPKFEKGHEKLGGRGKSVTPAAAKAAKLAGRYGPEAVRYLVKTMRDAEQNTSDRNAAAKEIMDRAYGKASASGSGGENVNVNVIIKGDDAKL